MFANRVHVSEHTCVVDVMKITYSLNTQGPGVALFFRFSTQYPEDKPLNIDMSKTGINKYRDSVFFCNFIFREKHTGANKITYHIHSHVTSNQELDRFLLNIYLYIYI